MGKTGLFDLERHFAFYGAYHSNPVNIFIHVLFVWPIFFTTLSICTSPHLSTLFPNPLVAGSNAALPCLICWVGESILAFRLGYSQTWKIVLTAQLFCWTNQLIDHGVFEKRAPALLDNLAQPFLMAPFFVFFEVLQSLFKYEPYPGFSASVQAKIKADIKEWKEQKEKLTTCLKFKTTLA
ncbi:hypothetical protein SDJN03_14938, partial [Cucurbita argyrosperma subsp. sororia]